MTTAEILSIGTELLLGEIVDTNSAHLARALRGIGLDLLHISQVGDNEARIAEAITRALERSDVVITTGGLGPTVDDVTREAAARAAGRTLTLSPELLAQVEARFARWGRRMSENNRRQAMIPEGAIPVENAVGTAPAFIVEVGSKAIACLPGVPKEMEHLLQQSILPYLRRRFAPDGVIKTRLLKTAGVGESLVDARIEAFERLTNPTVGLAAHPASVDVRITAKAASEAEADRMIAEIESQLRARLGEAVFGADADTVEGVTLATLKAAGKTLAVAEAATGGAITARLSHVPEAQAVFVAGMVTPTPETLAAGLGVDGAEERLGGLAALIALHVAAEHRASLGLACLVRVLEDGVRIGIGLSHGDVTQSGDLGFGGHPDLLPQWTATIATDRLRRWALRGFAADPSA